MNDALEGAMRGVIGALAMSGLRMFAADLGLVEKTPPQELVDKPGEGLIEKVPRDNRRAVVGALHCAVGAAGGAGYGVLPDAVRQQSWSGPVWGLAIWVTYEGGVAPLLGLKHARRVPPTERATVLTDHLLYGYILSETRRRPRY